MRPAGPVLATRHALVPEAPPPLRDSRGRNGSSAGYGARFRRIGAARQSGLPCSASFWHSYECSRLGRPRPWYFASPTHLRVSPRTTYRDITFRFIGNVAEVCHRSRAPALRHRDPVLLLVNMQANRSGLFDAARLLCVRLCAGRPAYPSSRCRSADRPPQAQQS
jgi:hypothetical protein